MDNKTKESIWVRLAGFPFVAFGVGLAIAMASVESNIAALTAATFAVLAGLAAACFSLARSIANEELQDRLVHCGERFLHGAVYLLLSAALAFCFLWLRQYWPSVGTHWLTLVVRAVLLIGLMLVGMASATGGVVALNWILWHRRNRYRYWDNPVPHVSPTGAKEGSTPTVIGAKAGTELAEGGSTTSG